jgi:hypothetical protein
MHEEMDKELKEEIKRITVKRLDAMPSNIKISIGNYGDFNKNQLIEHVKSWDEIGETVAEIQLNFLRSFKKGIVAGISENA